MRIQTAGLRHLIMAASALVLSMGVWAQSAMVDGVVRKVDAGGGTVKLEHAGIKNLNIPAMTMNFHVKDASWLKRLQPGEKVRFSAEKIDGQFTVTAIEPSN